MASPPCFRLVRCPEAAISATSLFIVFLDHFVTGLTGIEGSDTPPGNAETGTVIVGETSGVLLAVSSIVSVEPPDVCDILTL